MQTSAVFWEPSLSHSQLICLIMSGLLHACLHNKLSHKAGPVGSFKRCPKSLFEPMVETLFFFLHMHFSFLTSRNPMTTTSAEAMKASVALVSVSRGRALSEKERHERRSQ